MFCVEMVVGRMKEPLEIETGVGGCTGPYAMGSDAMNQNRARGLLIGAQSGLVRHRMGEAKETR